jgi:hypothetical protein
MAEQTHHAKPTAAQIAMAGLKTCPDCAEQVKAEARVCRFCRHEFPENQSSVLQEYKGIPFEHAERGSIVATVRGGRVHFPSMEAFRAKVDRHRS